ncbi:unnamed protein product, partial [Hapterophycus canaliculatus]
GVGVIPAGFILTPMDGGGSGGNGGGDVWAGAAGIGREDPLQAALLDRIGAVALGTIDGGYHRQPQRPRSTGRSGGGGRCGGDGAGSGADSSCSEGSRNDDDDEYDENEDDEWFGLEIPVGLTAASARSEAKSVPASSATVPGALTHLILRLRQLGADLASAQAKQQLGTLGAGKAAARMALGAAGALRAPGGLKARAVEMEQELTSVLCLLSSLTLAIPAAGCALARALPLEATLVPILAAQRGVLAGADPVDYPRAPVEIVLVSLTLIAQLGMELGRVSGGGGASAAAAGEVSADRERRRARGRRRRGRRDAARAARLRRFLGEQAAAGEVKLCLGHAACRAESKDLARRASALISLLQ